MDPPTVTVTVGDMNKRILSEKLLEFWQQFRDFGLTHGGIAVERRFASHSMPVYAEMPHVEPVMVSMSSSGLRSKSVAGLQAATPRLTPAPASGRAGPPRCAWREAVRRNG